MGAQRYLPPQRHIGFAAFVALLIAIICTAPARADSPDTPNPQSDLAIADRVMHAFDLLGTPYRKRGTSPETGFDCSGFIGWVFLDANGIALPRSAREIYALNAKRAAKIDRDALAPGDLVFFHIGRLGKRVDHVGMYVGEGRFVHAPASGGEVRIDTLALPYWHRHYAGARRILDAPVPAAVPASSPSPDGLAAEPAIGKDSVSRVAENVPPDHDNTPEEASP